MAGGGRGDGAVEDFAAAGRADVDIGAGGGTGCGRKKDGDFAGGGCAAGKGGFGAGEGFAAGGGPGVFDVNLVLLAEMCRRWWGDRKAGAEGAADIRGGGVGGGAPERRWATGS